MTIIRLFTVRVRPAQLCTNILLQPVLVLKHTHVIYTVHRSVYTDIFILGLYAGSGWCISSPKNRCIFIQNLRIENQSKNLEK